MKEAGKKMIPEKSNFLMMQSARFSATEFSPKVHLVISFFSNQTFQNRIQDSSASGQAPVHSEWYREMAE